jgi:hypothetical protein
MNKVNSSHNSFLVLQDDDIVSLEMGVKIGNNKLEKVALLKNL